MLEHLVPHVAYAKNTSYTYVVLPNTTNQKEQQFPLLGKYWLKQLTICDLHEVSQVAHHTRICRIRLHTVVAKPYVQIRSNTKQELITSHQTQHHTPHFYHKNIKAYPNLNIISGLS